MNILITGGTGSLGSALARKWYADGHNLTILSRNPHNQAKLTKELPNATFVLTDICNYGEVRRACTGQDVLIHAAAIKQVDVGEYHPIEFGRVNWQGSVTVANAWAETHRTYSWDEDGMQKPLPTMPRKALLISTDKAVCAINAYGKSKALAESSFRKFDYSVLRYGNVVESRGSFLNAWQACAEGGSPLTVRSPEPTRFFLRMEDAIALIEDALTVMDDHNGIFVPRNLAAFSVWDVAVEFNQEMKYEPLLPYEKRDEWLVAVGEDAIPVSDLLCEIRPTTWETGPPGEFCSASAHRLEGWQVLKKLGWE